MIDLPWPSQNLSPNARVHWSVRARSAKRYRADCGMVAKSLARSIPEGKPLVLQVTFCPPSKRAYDLDNLVARFKAGQDGIADAIGVNDAMFVPEYLIGEVVRGGNVKVSIKPKELA
jgi:crossover junction endodeoxyribonuclease RusA